MQACISYSGLIFFFINGAFGCGKYDDDRSQKMVISKQESKKKNKKNNRRKS